MFSLRDISAHQLPQNQTPPEVVSRSILLDVKKEIFRIIQKISAIDAKYMKMFKHYTNILDPHCNIGADYAKSHGEEYLYDIIVQFTSQFKTLYGNLSEEIDEGNEWFAYLEYMNFRTMPPPRTWIFSEDDAQNDLLELFLTVKGIIHTVAVVPEPRGPVPDELEDMKNIFFAYIEHLVKLDDFIEKRYSFKRVSELQKKYVETYKLRTAQKKPLTRALNFYKNIRNKLASSLYIPDICKKRT